MLIIVGVKLQKRESALKLEAPKATEPFEVSPFPLFPTLDSGGRSEQPGSHFQGTFGCFLQHDEREGLPFQPSRPPVSPEPGPHAEGACLRPLALDQPPTRLQGAECLYSGLHPGA